MMRVVAFIVLFMVSVDIYPAEIRTIEQAREYLTESGPGGNWVVISSGQSGRYVQCMRMDDFLRCPFPVWLQAVPGEGLVGPSSSRGTPFPAVAGSIKREYIASAEVKKLKRAIGELGLKPVDVYNQMVDEGGRVVGTSYDVVVILEPPYGPFVPFVGHIFEAVWGVPPGGKYLFETNR